MSGLKDMRIEPMKIELPSDGKYHRAHGVDAGVPATKSMWMANFSVLHRSQHH